MQEMQETQVQSQGWKDPMEYKIAAHSNILAWKIPWTEEPDELQSMGLQRVRYVEPWSTHTHIHIINFKISLFLFLRSVFNQS